MRKAQLIEMLGDSVVVAGARDFRYYLDVIPVYRKDNRELKWACEKVCLISYWINADDGTCCPVDSDSIERTVCILLDVLIEFNGYEKVRKNRFNYESLGDLHLFGGLGTKTFANIIKLLDILYLEYVAKRQCPRCGQNIGSSDIICGYCEHILNKR